MGLILNKIKFAFIFTALFSAFFLVSASTARAGEKFFIESSFDVSSRITIKATKRLEGNKAHYYVEDDYYNLLSPFGRTNLLSDIQSLSDAFDKQIYNSVTLVFGLPWTPGIDGDTKITVVLTQTQKRIGGYFREQDEYLLSEVSDSNEREMVYLNVALIDQFKIKEFLAHEFQHLINFNQKTRIKNIYEEIWLNELLSEVAVTVSDLHTSQFIGTSLENRVNTFLSTPSDSLLDWKNEPEDYGVVSMFGNYLYDHFGAELFTKIIQSEKVGIDAINDALNKVGANKNFEDVYRNWTIAVLLNNCSVVPVDTYCYKNPNLNYDNLHIKFDIKLGTGDSISNSNTIDRWGAEWFQYTKDLETTKPDKPILIYDLIISPTYDALIPYIVYDASGFPNVNFAFMKDGLLRFAVNNFGFTTGKLVVIPYNNTSATIKFTQNGHLETFIPADIENYIVTEEVFEQVKTPMSTSTDSVPDGSLIRARGDDRVYITKGKYKRWIQSAEIINMYGHLQWEDVIEISTDTLNNYLDSNVVKFAGDKKVYQLSGIGIKTWIQTEQEFLNLGYKFDMVYEINERELAFYRF